MIVSVALILSIIIIMSQYYVLRVLIILFAVNNDVNEDNLWSKTLQSEGPGFPL